MTTQQPGQQSDKSRMESQKRTQLHRIRWIIVIIVLILIAAGTVIWLLTLQGTWITILPLVIFTILGIIIALFQWLFPVSSNTSEHPSTIIHPSLYPTTINRYSFSINNAGDPCARSPR
jgi:fatty acid desaturase